MSPGRGTLRRRGPEGDACPTGRGTPPGLPIGLVLLWVMLALEAAAVLAIYWRTPAAELYHVTQSGLPEAARRTLGFAAYPTALVGAGIALLVADRLPARSTAAACAFASVALGVSVVLAASAAEADVDATPASIGAVVGLAIAVAMTVLLVRRYGIEPLRRLPWDTLRLAVGVAVLAVSMPWLAALLGLSLDRVPLLGWLFITEVAVDQPGSTTPLSAVHDGHHHGLDGASLVWAGLILSRELDRFCSRALHTTSRALIALFLAYGGWNAAQDFWLEQIVKRDLTNMQLPYVIGPALSRGWLCVVGAACLSFVALGRVTPHRAVRPAAA